MARYKNNLILFLIFAVTFAGASQANETGRTPDWLRVGLARHIAQSTDRLIVKYKSSFDQNSDTARAKTLGAASGQPLRRLRALDNNIDVVALPTAVSNSEARKLAAAIESNPSVEYAEPDYRMFPLLTPTDPGFSPGIDFDPAQNNIVRVLQWYLSDPIGSINAPNAWNISTGSTATVVAVIDTGVLAHVDLNGRLLNGYDFIGADPDGSFDTANDGDGRDPDARDPGNWVTPEEAGTGNYADCKIPAESDWHGTHVAGIIGANPNNNQIAGVNWAAKILPIRVLGKCGGYTSDIVDGMRWAVGMPIANIPDNPNRANVVNLSLGIGSDTNPPSCSRTMQSAINDVLARSGTVVVAAGNGDENGRPQNSSNVVPANCAGVINVAATLKGGSFATTYSNFGPLVSLSAPGGLLTGVNSDFGQNGILSLNDNGAQRSLNDGKTASFFGTSFSAAMVSGVASLMLGVNPNLTPVQVKAILQSTARLPSNQNETGFNCGLIANHPCQQYVVDAEAAVNQAKAINNGAQGILQILDSNGQALSLLDFGSAALQQSIGPKTIVVRNSSSSTTRIDSVLVAGQHVDDFSASTSCANPLPANKYPFDLSAGSSCEIDVVFTPQGNDVRDANIVVVSNFNLSVAITGVGPQSSSGSDSGAGGGCVLNRDRSFDPILLWLLLTSTIVLAYRRRSRQ